MFPEMSLSGYADDPAIKNCAEATDGPLVKKLESIAALNNIYLSAGMIERENENNYNTQLMIGPHGYIGRYRKVYPTGVERRTLDIKPGTEYPVFTIKNDIKVGINICKDSRHIDTVDTYAAEGVQLILSPHSNKGFGSDAETWTRGKLVYYLERIIKCRAYYLVNNMSGQVKGSSGQTFGYPGGAMILDPLGQVVERSIHNTNDESMVIAELDTDLTVHIPWFEIERMEKNKQHA